MGFYLLKPWSCSYFSRTNCAAGFWLFSKILNVLVSCLV